MSEHERIGWTRCGASTTGHSLPIIRDVRAASSVRTTLKLGGKRALLLPIDVSILGFLLLLLRFRVDFPQGNGCNGGVRMFRVPESW